MKRTPHELLKDRLIERGWPTEVDVATFNAKLAAEIKATGRIRTLYTDGARLYYMTDRKRMAG